ncbi:hypothetical protein BJV74DRAFT_954499 [Russula compacta]|nr:hypothetical protein BJV74DRAFT_954499 [Russula compacta]
MTRGQSFGDTNSYRRQFYHEVADFSPEVEGHFGKDHGGRTPNYQIQRAVREVGEDLCHFIDPDGLLDSGGPRRPLVILAFDEAHTITETRHGQSWTPFSELCRTLRCIEDSPIFSLFLSTMGNFDLFSPKIRNDPSNRIANNEIAPLHPISEISFDDLAYPARESTITLDRVVKMDWMSHLGRPLFGSRYDASGRDDVDLMDFATYKLLNGNTIDDNAPGSLACLCVRFALEFNSDPDSRAVTRKQVERHMRLCIDATAGFERLVTIAGSEPLLAEAASRAMRASAIHPVVHLARHSNLNCIDRGRRGELVAALVIMQARDNAARASPANRRWVSVREFMKALLPSSHFDQLQDSRPYSSRPGEDISFNDTFSHYAMWFNHVIKIQHGKMINSEHLWKYITRGAMVICADNQHGVDIVYPLVMQRVQRWVEETLFDSMDPFDVGLFSDGQQPRPVLRVVSALASPQSSVIVRPNREAVDDADQFTAFDIWCAGLTQSTFECIEEKDVESYKLLLERSLRPHDAFESKGDSNINKKTRRIRGDQRRRLAALVMPDAGHNSIHPIGE